MGGTHLLPALVGPQVASRMLLTGELISAEQAKEDRLVAAVEPDALGASLELAQRISQQGPLAVRSCLKTLRGQLDRGLDEALQREADAQAQSYASAELTAGVLAAREKRS